MHVHLLYVSVPVSVGCRNSEYELSTKFQSFTELVGWMGCALLTCFTSCEDGFSRQPKAIKLQIEMMFKYEVT